MKHVTQAALAALVLASVLAAGAGAAPMAPEETDPGQRYDSCLAQVALDARAALAAAEAWRGAGGGTPAGHCAALAMIELDRPAEAATLMLALAHEEGGRDQVLRADILGQAGNAFLLAGDGDSARQAFDLALAIRVGNPDLLLDRARANALSKNWEAAIADLDAVILHAPDDATAYVLRASAKRQAGDPRAAKSDAEAALLRQPRNYGALLERAFARRDTGDTAGAREDFEGVISMAPDTSAATSAREALDALN